MRRIVSVMLTLGLVLCCANAGAADLDEMVTDAIKAFSKTLDTIPDDLKTVAVYKIEPDSKGEINISALQDQIGQALLEVGGFRVIDRKSLKSLMEEQKLSLTGAVDEREMVKVGKLIGVKGFF